MEPRVLVYVEQEDGVPKRTALEAGSKAAELAGNGDGTVTGVVLGVGAARCVDVLRRHGFDEILVCEDAAFGDFLVDPHVEIVAQVIGNRRPRRRTISRYRPQPRYRRTGRGPGGGKSGIRCGRSDLARRCMLRRRRRFSGGTTSRRLKLETPQPVCFWFGRMRSRRARRRVRAPLAT